ncbi:MAG: ABC transporter permease subunit [Actinomycetota bacterium]|nr:ABC transporter permease subunit [Actinomycetota bacterium]
MLAEQFPITTDVLHAQRRSIPVWGAALAAVSAMYISFYPSMGGDQMDDMIANLPDNLVTALGYDQIGTAGGWLTSTVYGLLGPALLLVFAIGTGGRLLAGQEEAGTLELELTSPVPRRRIYVERLVALWCGILALVAMITLVTVVLVAAIDMEVGLTEILAGSTGLSLLVVGLGTFTFAVGAATGRRAHALGAGAAVAVAAFILDALGPVVELGWMTAISPFSWYLGNNPLVEGFDLFGLARLALITLVCAPLGALALDRRDLMV